MLRALPRALGLSLLGLAMAVPAASQVATSAQPEAQAAFDRGHAHYLGTEYRQALPYLYRAYELDSTFVVPLVFAALSHNNLTEYADTDSLVQELGKHRHRLDAYHTGWLSYLEGRMLGDNEAALRAIRRAAKEAPGSKAVYNQAFIAVGLNKPEEAARALETLDPMKAPMRGWFPYWNQLTRSYALLGQHDRQLEAARQARQHYPTSLAALYLETEAMAFKGNAKEIERLLEEGKTLVPAGGLNLGAVMTNTGVVLAATGDRGAASRLFERALEWFDAQPRETKLSENHRSWVAWTLYNAGRWPEARRAYRRLVIDFSEDRTYRGLLGVSSARDGDADEGALLAKWLEGETSPYVFGSNTFWRGHIAAASGDTADAVRLFREAVAEGFLLPRLFPWDPNLRDLRQDPSFQEFLRPAG